MSFQIDLNPFDRAYARFVRQVRDALQRTFAEESENGLTQKELAEALGIDQSLVSRRLHGPGNVTLRTLSDLYTAMGREPLSNFVAPERLCVQITQVKTSTYVQASSHLDGLTKYQWPDRSALMSHAIDVADCSQNKGKPEASIGKIWTIQTIQ